ncbi:hypothetical protein AGMMS49975_27750 [Clostridia bacterium]|nr:hypothetical protein AGMMS49975_27750 [Clostridia bacterium]
MTLGGFTQDDGFVVSKEFAEANENRIIGKDGELRPLRTRVQKRLKSVDKLEIIAIFSEDVFPDSLF